MGLITKLIGRVGRFLRRRPGPFGLRHLESPFALGLNPLRKVDGPLERRERTRRLHEYLDSVGVEMTPADLEEFEELPESATPEEVKRWVVERWPGLEQQMS